MRLSAVPISELPRLREWKAKGDMTVVDGVEIFSRASNNFGSKSTKKPALIVVHGYPTSSFDFWKIYPQLEEHFNVFCWDYAGYGFSEKVHRTISQQIDLLEALLVEKKYTCSSADNVNHNLKLKAHILSHDLGNALVQEMLARGDSFCVVIQSIVMLNGSILPKLHRPTIVQQAMLIPGLNILTSYLANHISVFQVSISKVFGPNTKPTDQEIQEYFALVTCNGGDRLLTKNITYITERQVFHDRWVDAIKVYASKNSFCLIDGPADPVSGRHLAEAVQAEIIGAKVVFLNDDIGHWPQVEAPEETMKAFLEFHREIKTSV